MILFSGLSCCTCKSKKDEFSIAGHEVPLEYLEPFQNMAIPMDKLKDKHEQQMRVQGSPFINLYVIQFFNELRMLSQYVELKHVVTLGDNVEV